MAMRPTFAVGKGFADAGAEPIFVQLAPSSVER